MVRSGEAILIWKPFGRTERNAFFTADDKERLICVVLQSHINVLARHTKRVSRYLALAYWNGAPSSSLLEESPPRRSECFYESVLSLIPSLRTRASASCAWRKFRWNNRYKPSHD